ncbi:MAG: hypothetical protein EOP49_17670, partial [Sphingobacteriales bacterium]
MTMKKYIRNFRLSLLAGLGMLICNSCAKNGWDDHYSVPEYLNSGSIANVLASDGTYSEFSSLLKKTGYDSLLRKSSLHTVLAVKNGGFSGIDTSANTALLRQIIGMHIFPVAIYQQDMNHSTVSTVTGKTVSFFLSGDTYTANGQAINAGQTKTLNGQILSVSKAIVPNPSLAEVIATVPGFGLYNEYLQGSFSQIPDPLRNTVIGTDATMKPIYRLPIIFKAFSKYLTETRLDDEKTVSTVFAPTDQVVDEQLSRLLTARAGRTDLIIPKLGTNHGDTTIGYYFFPRNATYPGDSAILKDYLFNHVVVRGGVANLAAGLNTFTNVKGSPLQVQGAQVTGAAKPASNGMYYTLNDLDLPELAYRSKFMFQPSLKNPAPATTYSLNPGVSFSGGAVYNNDVTSNYQNTYRGRASRFNFVNIGAAINFTMPFVTKGRYRVVLKNFLDNNGCIVNVSYGSQLLKQNLNVSTQYALSEISVDVDLGNIDVAATGPVQLTFKCANVSPRAAVQYLFTVDM